MLLGYAVADVVILHHLVEAIEDQEDVFVDGWGTAGTASAQRFVHGPPTLPHF
jgi:hypothetical protein